MIVVLVRHDQCLDRFAGHVDGGEPLLQRLGVESRVDQHARASVLQQHRIPATSTA
jgi:hypothetical protein